MTRFVRALIEPTREPAAGYSDTNITNNDIFVINRENLFPHLEVLMAQIRDTKLLKKIATIVKELREAKNVSQEEVYNEINIHIGRIETAKANVSVSTLSALCKYFKISLSEFHKKVENL